MYADANQVPHGATLHGFDICIVGAGAAGIALANRLVASNKKVLLLSNGDSLAKAQTLMDESIYRGVTGPFLRKVDPEFLTRSRLRMFGGTTNHFTYWSQPLEETDLQPRPGYRSAPWPIGIDELNRYYQDANDTAHFGPFNYEDITFWAQAANGSPFPELPGDMLRNTILHQQPDDRINHFQEQFGPALQAAANMVVLHNANALLLDASEGRSHVTSVTCASTAAGKPNRYFKVAAQSYVLALGGIEVVRLLKLSGNLGDNAKGHLGRGFMLHPVITEAARVTFSSPVAAPLVNFFQAREVTVPRRLTADLDRTDPRNRCTFFSWGNLAPKPEVMAVRKIGNFRLLMRFETPQATTVEISFEQVPNENSRIALHPVATDPVFQQPVVQIDWNLLEEDKQTARTALKLCRDYLLTRDPGAEFELTTDLDGGAEQWTTDGSDRRLQAGDHHMGATRMSLNSDDGIVNPNLRLHRVDNIYIASSAVFPTGGVANPTLTIVGLSLRLADHLAEVRS